LSVAPETIKAESVVSSIAVVAEELAEVDPKKLVATSTARTYPFVVITCAGPVAPEMSVHDDPLGDDCHLNERDVAPVHDPATAVSVEPMHAVPLMVGNAVFTGGTAPGSRQFPPVVLPDCRPRTVPTKLEPPPPPALFPPPPPPK
jgi:hypothetical protein